MAERCTNCSKYYYRNENMEFCKYPKVNGESGEIRIWDVIAYVYRMDSISLDDFKTHFKKANDQENNLMDDLLEVSLGMCDLCLSLLSDTYKTLTKFESLTHQESLIQLVQNKFSRNWEDCTEVNPLTILVPDSLSLSSLAKTGDEDLFDSYNFEDDNSPNETDICLKDEFKYETAEDLFETESPSVTIQETIQKVENNPELTSTSLKQLMVKIDRISGEDLKTYANKKHKINCASRMEQRKKGMVMAVQKLKFEAGVQRSYSLGQHKKQQLSTARFTNRNSLRKIHKPTHFPNISCKLCDQVFTHGGSFLKHMESEHKSHMRTPRPKPRVRETLKCDQCDQQYLNKVAYKIHLLKHSDNYSPYLCRHCGSTFDYKSNLHQHERRHTEEKQFSCEICSNKFFSKPELNRHMAVHSEEKTFVCDECGMSYKRRSHLSRYKRIHKQVAEKGEYSSKCKYCGKLCKHIDSLQRHLKIHEKKYECSFCGKLLSRPERLKSHEDLHRQNPDYQPKIYKYWNSDRPYKYKPSSETN